MKYHLGRSIAFKVKRSLRTGAIIYFTPSDKTQPVKIRGGSNSISTLFRLRCCIKTGFISQVIKAADITNMNFVVPIASIDKHFSAAIGLKMYQYNQAVRHKKAFFGTPTMIIMGFINHFILHN
jgi:hypothetical protein